MPRPSTPLVSSYHRRRHRCRRRPLPFEPPLAASGSGSTAGRAFPLPPLRSPCPLPSSQTRPVGERARRREGCRDNEAARKARGTISSCANLRERCGSKRFREDHRWVRRDAADVDDSTEQRATCWQMLHLGRRQVTPLEINCTPCTQALGIITSLSNALRMAGATSAT